MSGLSSDLIIRYQWTKGRHASWNINAHFVLHWPTARGFKLYYYSAAAFWSLSFSWHSCSKKLLFGPIFLLDRTKLVAFCAVIPFLIMKYAITRVDERLNPFIQFTRILPEKGRVNKHMERCFHNYCTEWH